MNRWKIAFWICLAILLTVSCLSLYIIVDQGVTITYMKEGYDDTEDDMEELIFFINSTDLYKEEVTAHVLRYENYGDQDKGDTLYLKTVNLIFENNKLKKVVKSW